MIVRKRRAAAEEKRREALHRADRATVSLAPAASTYRPKHRPRRSDQQPHRPQWSSSEITRGTTLHRRRKDPAVTATTAAVLECPRTLSVRTRPSTTRRDHDSANAKGDRRIRRILSPPPRVYASSSGKKGEGLTPTYFVLNCLVFLLLRIALIRAAVEDAAREVAEPTLRGIVCVWMGGVTVSVRGYVRVYACACVRESNEPSPNTLLRHAQKPSLSISLNLARRAGSRDVHRSKREKREG